MPLRIGLLGEPQPAGTNSLRARGGEGKDPAELRQETVCLPGIAFRAAGHAILPGMGSAPTTGNDMINCVSGTAAVRTSTAISPKDARSGDRCRRGVGHADEPVESKDRWNGQAEGWRMDLFACGTLHQALGLARQHEHHRSASVQDCEWLVRGVQQQNSAHPRRYLHRHLDLHHPAGQRASQRSRSVTASLLVNLAGGCTSQTFLVRHCGDSRHRRIEAAGGGGCRRPRWTRGRG